MRSLVRWISSYVKIYPFLFFYPSVCGIHEHTRFSATNYDYDLDLSKLPLHRAASLGCGVCLLAPCVVVQWFSWALMSQKGKWFILKSHLCESRSYGTLTADSPHPPNQPRKEYSGPWERILMLPIDLSLPRKSPNSQKVIRYFVLVYQLPFF